MEIQYDLQPKDIWATTKNSRIFSEKLRVRLSYVQFLFWPLGIYLVQVIFLLTDSVPVSFALTYPVFYTFIGAFVIGPLLLELLFYVQYKRFISKPKNLHNKKIVFQKGGCEFTTQEKTFL
ncbi:hypothetical protein [Aquibacillus rhizosphaerae]|uniref:Uncharacterized protein n=1 Tax=Aquibacillus rhizosphaerae TaxID=3051431 RepID=A0ABT7L7C9_9BACI|nr:hypothetical protein [Aquibacillus sp. LR5S19]MDL4841766.1 hypothetical protein [Aquibacillus sp. LR5S19]